jgi:hypothetical protein
MKTLLKLKHVAPLGAIVFAFVLFGIGCSETPNTSVKQIHIPNSYIIPATLDTFNAGNLHNAELYYIFTHYDTVKYASYPNKFSQRGIDSLAALFIIDSIQTTNGPLTSGEINTDTLFFDSVSNACASAPPPHSQLVASVDTAEAHGILASDEGNFIINADTDILLCTSDAQIRDTISSLISRYYSITWASSVSQGVDAYEYLSIANHSIKFWGQVGDTVPILPPVSADAASYDNCLIEGQLMQLDGTLLNGETPEEFATQCSAAASQGTATHGGLLGPNGGKIILISTGVAIIIILILSAIFGFP